MIWVKYFCWHFFSVLFNFRLWKVLEEDLTAKNICLNLSSYQFLGGDWKLYTINCIKVKVTVMSDVNILGHTVRYNKVLRVWQAKSQLLICVGANSGGNRTSCRRNHRQNMSFTPNETKCQIESHFFPILWYLLLNLGERIYMESLIWILYLDI